MTEWVAKNNLIWIWLNHIPHHCALLNWVKWQLSKEAMSSEILNSLATQTRWLYRHIEWHILGNHLLAMQKR